MPATPRNSPRCVATIPKQFLTGYHGPLEIPLTIVAVLIVAYAGFRLVAAAPGPERYRALVFAGLGAAAIVAAVVLALIGPDYLIVRNVLPAWLPLAVAVATGLVASGVPREGIAAAAVLCAIGLVQIVAVASDQRYQRDDWRDAARALGPVTQTRAIIVTPASGKTPLLFYLRGAQPVPPEGIQAKEIDFIGMAPRLPGQVAHPPRPTLVALANFNEFARQEAATYTVVKERSANPVPLTPTVGVSALDGRPAVVLYQRGQGP